MFAVLRDDNVRFELFTQPQMIQPQVHPVYLLINEGG